jgi:hypothetical protein
MPKPPGVVGRLPEWQIGGGGRGKKGVPKIFLDFENFEDLRAYKWVVEGRSSGMGVSEKKEFLDFRSSFPRAGND